MEEKTRRLMMTMALLLVFGSVCAQEPADVAPDDAYLKAMQLDEEDELDQEPDSDSVRAEAVPSRKGEPQAPADALKEQIDEIVEWAPDPDPDCGD